MKPGELFSMLGTELVWQVILAGFALLAAIAAGVPLLQRRRVHPLLLLGGALLACASPLLLGRACLWAFGERGVEVLRLQVTTFAAVHLLAPLTAGPTLSATMLLQAFGGARATPRDWRGPVAAGVGVGAAAAVVAVTGLATGNPVYAVVRAGAYAVFGTLVAVGTVGSGPDDRGGRDAAVAAGCAFPLLVAVGEASERGLVVLLLSQATSAVPTGRWEDGAAWILGNVRTEWGMSWLALGFAAIAALPGAARGGWRGALAWPVAVTLAASLLLGSDLGDHVADLAPLVP